MDEDSQTKRVSFGQKETLIIDETMTSPTDADDDVHMRNGHIQDGGTKPEPGMESRDNPFTPDGDLSRETEELLRHSTVIRDKFILAQGESATSDSEHEDKDRDCVSEEAITETVEKTVNAQPHDRLTEKQNGKLEETKPVDKDETKAMSDGVNDSTNVKDKKQKKCCAIL